MKKNEADVISIMFDLNCKNWTNFHFSQEKEKARNPNNNNLQDLMISFEEIIDTILQSMNISIAQNPLNIVAFYIYDENDVKRIFPESDEDELNMKMLDFKKIRQKIHNSLSQFIQDKQFSTDPVSKFVSALSQTLCYINKLTVQNKEVQYSNRL